MEYAIVCGAITPLNARLKEITIQKSASSNLIQQSLFPRRLLHSIHISLRLIAK